MTSECTVWPHGQSLEKTVLNKLSSPSWTFMSKWCLFFLITLVYFKKMWWLIENRCFFHMVWNKILDKQKTELSGNNRWQCFKDEEMKAWIPVLNVSSNIWWRQCTYILKFSSTIILQDGPVRSWGWREGEKLATCHIPTARNTVSL